MMTERALNRLEKVLKCSGDELIAKLEECIESRNTILSITERGFEIGDIVIDLKNEEVGFVVGPLGVWGDLYIDEGNIGDKDTVLIVTLNQNLESPSRWRVRYTKKELLKPVDLDMGEKPHNKKKDIKDFCGNMCIMSCSDDCPLWKYKK